MPKLGSVLGATRGGHKDALTSGRGGRPRGHGATGFRIQSNRGAARGRGRGHAQLGRPTTSVNGAQIEKESPANIPASSSPFAAIKNDALGGFGPTASSPVDGSQSSSVFGKPSFNPGSMTSNGFGTPSIAHQPKGNVNQPKREPRRKAISQGRSPNEQIVELNPTGGTKTVDYQERYEKLKLDRVRQREKAIKQGQMADPNQPTLLNKAITPVGTCTTMCPEFERVERIVQKMVDKSEKSLDPTTNSLEVRELKMLKRFRRSAAGYDEQLPSDIRTPNTLLQSMNYLIRHVVSGPDPLGLIHKFVWDRTRSIRNDFSVQQLTKVEDIKIAVKCLERIARFHIISLHLLSSPDNEEQFDHHQEREQLNNTMLSLMHYYDDNRERIDFLNEPEFRAYYIVLAIHDQRPDIEDRVQKWPQEILQSPKVQVALELLAAANNYWEYQIVLDTTRPNAISQGFYDRFFGLVDSPSVSYLMGCVAEIYFNNVRQTAIRTIWKAYCRVPISQQHKNEDWTLDELTRALYFDDESQAEKFCEEQGLQLMERTDGSLYLNWGTSSIDIVDFAPSSRHSFSEKYVEVKRGGRTLAAIILGLNIAQAATRGMIDTSLLPADGYGTPIDEDDNELFVSQNDQPPHAGTGLFQDHSEPLLQPATGEPAALVTSDKPFGLFQPPAVSVGTVQTSPFVNIPSSDTPAKPLLATNSLFSASTHTSASGPSQSPFSQISASTSAPSQGTISANTSQPQFSCAASTQSSSINPTTLTATAPVEQPKPTSSWASSSRTSANIFKTPDLSTTTVELKPQSSFSTSPVTTPLFPAQNSTPEAPPFSTYAETSKPLFSWQPNPQISDPASKAPDLLAATNDVKPAPVLPSSPFSFQTSNIKVSPTISEVASDSIFSKSLPSQNSPVTLSTPAPNGLFSRQKQQIEQTTSHVETEDKVSSKTQMTSQSLPSSASNANLVTNSNQEFTSVESAVELQQDQPLVDDSRADSVLPVTEPLPRPESSIDDSDFRKSWIETLRQSAIDNRTSQVNRKRPLEAEKEEITQPREKKTVPVDKPKVRREKVVKSKSKPPPGKQKKQSLALASIAPLPTLPILEKVKQLTQVKEPVQDETVSSRRSQIDEDEMLLSAARIAAEQLKSGPKLLGKASDYSYVDPLRSSTYFGRSLDSGSRTLSSSESSSSPHACINGYDLALAPETPLGLGRTLSRTEQRLRFTGGKGLAYKPLQLTPDKDKLTKKSDKIKFDLSSDS
ncbi:hypothetical protein UA08_00269 [Talaromyces atroroseus]|uniref:SAC3/GANP/THP3 conserved domain-containing protein n=1 Tax=Talaromyces atroroseus TaxID=1441469 RepID=A0A225APT2_TALAT|nr:hypothetical protein UA08_00269 [Talaromyces atroroseus]OKL63631.1 hypothetical protein UA08_00269 [Talaromyces atroroseus]